MWTLSKYFAMVGLLITLGLANGCALSKDHVEVSYLPIAGVKQLSEARNVAVTVTVDDQREIKDKISRKINGYGMQMAPILCDNSVPGVIQDAFETELRDHGFHIGAGGPTIAVQLHKFYNNFKLGMWSGTAVADVKFNASVVDMHGTSVYSRFIEAEHRKTCGIASGKNACMSLEDALPQAMAQLFDDREFIKSLMKAGAQPHKAVSDVRN